MSRVESARRCRRRPGVIGRDAHLRVVIAGLGKSGTTALYFAVRAAMPPDTHCLFEPAAYHAVVAPAVLAKVLVNTVADWSTFSGFDRKIFIARDPRDRLVSSLLYAIYDHRGLVTEAAARPLLHLLERKEAAARDVALWRISEAIEQITGRDYRALTRERGALCQRFLQENPGLHRIAYEDFIAGRTEALADYLGFAVPRGADVEVDASVRRVTRTRSSGDWRNWFTAEDVAYFRPVLDEAMQAFGYQDAWELAASPAIAPANGSEYVRRLLTEQRERTGPRPA